MRCAVTLTACWVLGIVGCRGGGPTPTLPRIVVDSSAYSGSAIGAPTTRPVDPDQGWMVRTTLLALTEDPGLVLQPLSARGRLFAQPAQGEPILATPQLLRRARIGDDEAARTWFSALQDPAAKRTVGVTESFATLAEGSTLRTSVSLRDRLVEWRLHRSGTDTLDLLVLAKGMLESADAPPALAQESVLVDAMSLDVNHPIVVVLPVDFEKTGVKSLAARFDFSLPSSDERFVEAAGRTREMLDRSSGMVAGLPTGLPTGPDAWSGYERALARADTNRRASLSFVAMQTGAPIANDLVLVAGDEVLDEISRRLLETMPQLQRDPKLLGWQMDSIALQICAERAEKGTLSREMMSVLVIHAGEAGRNVGSIGSLLKNVRTRSDLVTRLTVENMIYLEDSSPGARVRAYDWLAARGKAPPGYDPLGPFQQRREALERAAAPTTQGATP